MIDLIFRMLLVIFGIVGFLVVILFPWLLGISEILDMLTKKEWWYYRRK